MLARLIVILGESVSVPRAAGLLRKALSLSLPGTHSTYDPLLFNSRSPAVTA